MSNDILAELARYLAMPIEYENDPIFQDQPNNYMQLMQKLDIMRTALLNIRQAHVPDQPMSSAGNELSWVMSHVGMIRNIATVALDKIK